MIRTDEKFDITFMDASRISTFSRCEARFLFSCLMGLNERDSSTIALDYGTVMHRVLPHMYSGETEKAIETWTELWPLFPHGEDNYARNTSASIMRISDFVLNHKPEICPYEILHYDFSSPTKLISENEVPFLIDIGASYPLCGRIDAIIRWKSTGAIWCYDFKTASEISDRYFAGFWLAPQACTYTVAASHITGEEIEGMVYEAMRISSAKTMNIETQIGFSPLHEHNIRTYLDETKLTCARIEAANETGCWRQNHALCSTYSSFGYPCKICEFKMLCDSPNWQDVTKFYEKRKPFNPLDEDHD